MLETVEQTVFIVDDDEAVRDSLEWLLESHRIRVRAYPSPQAFLDACDLSLSGCLVLDVRMPDMSGLELHEKLKDLGMSWPVVFITGHGDVPMAVSALKGGAVDFIEKPFRDEDMLKLVQKCLAADSGRRAQRDRGLAVRERHALLTDREREVMERIVAGRLNKQIADDLSISIKTVEVHRGRIMDKMRAKTVVDLVQLSRWLEGPQQKSP